MSCPWANIKKQEVPNLTEIMSEELAKELQDKENEKFNAEFTQGKLDVAGALFSDSTAKTETELKKESLNDFPVYENILLEAEQNDAVIAEMLQIQYDKEHDKMLKKIEEKFNGASKVSISFENYKRIPSNFEYESSDEDDGIDEILEAKDVDRFEKFLRDVSSMPVCGYKINQNGEIITKHDLVNNDTKNALKLLSLGGPGFHTGDGEDFDLKISNRVFNKLKSHANKEETKKKRLEDRKEDHRAATEFGLDSKTCFSLYKLIDSTRILKNVNGIIGIGKEAVIIHAFLNTEYRNEDNNIEKQLPNECALKIFRNVGKFKNRPQNKQNKRKSAHIYAEQEKHHLTIIKREGIPCPDPLYLKDNILFISFIGENGVAAPKLKDAHLNEADLIIAYDQVIEFMKTLYRKANLVHADLSEYNILWFKEMCYFIDFRQSVQRTHKNAQDFLYLDCSNIINFFSKKKLTNILSPEELYQEITGISYSSVESALSEEELEENN